MSRDELDALGAEATVAKILSRVGGVVEVFGQHSKLFSVSAKSDVTGSPLWDTYREATQPLFMVTHTVPGNQKTCILLDIRVSEERVVGCCAGPHVLPLADSETPNLPPHMQPTWRPKRRPTWNTFL